MFNSEAVESALSFLQYLVESLGLGAPSEVVLSLPHPYGLCGVGVVWNFEDKEPVRRALVGCRDGFVHPFFPRSKTIEADLIEIKRRVEEWIAA